MKQKMDINDSRKEIVTMRNLDKYKGVIPAFYACYDKEGNIVGQIYVRVRE